VRLEPRASVTGRVVAPVQLRRRVALRCLNANAATDIRRTVLWAIAPDAPGYSARLLDERRIDVVLDAGPAATAAPVVASARQRAVELVQT